MQSQAKSIWISDCNSVFRVKTCKRLDYSFDFLSSSLLTPFVRYRHGTLCQILVKFFFVRFVPICQICCGSSFVLFELHSTFWNSIISLPVLWLMDFVCCFWVFECIEWFVNPLSAFLFCSGVVGFYRFRFKTITDGCVFYIIVIRDDVRIRKKKLLSLKNIIIYQDV